MSDKTYNAKYFKLIARFIKAGIPNPRKCFWYLPPQWACHRKTQIAAMTDTLNKFLQGA